MVDGQCHRQMQVDCIVVIVQLEKAEGWKHQQRQKTGNIVAGVPKVGAGVWMRFALRRQG